MRKIILYIIIIATFIVITVSYWSSLSELQDRGKSVAAVTGESSLIMATLTQTIHSATSVNLPVTGGAGTSLSLNVADPAKNPTTVSFSAGKLLFQEGTNTPMNLVTDQVTLTGINFINLSQPGMPAAIKIQFELSSGGYATTLYDTASLRK